MRVLGNEDMEALRALVARDPVTNVFIDSLLGEHPLAMPRQPGSQLLGLFDGGELAAACWVGSNIVPIEVTAEQSRHFGRWLGSHWRVHASIFGPADAVLGIMEQLTLAGVRAQEVRPRQPLLVLDTPPAVQGPAQVVPSTMAQFERVLTAAVAMFEEEVGYSPFLGGEENYRRRVAWLINHGHSLSHCAPDGEVLFKADLGVVTPRATQIQGVWLHPRSRGTGLSAGYMADVVRHAHTLAPVTSLYVNDYNTRARATYATVGFEQRGIFATVLF